MTAVGAPAHRRDSVECMEMLVHTFAESHGSPNFTRLSGLPRTCVCAPQKVAQRRKNSKRHKKGHEKHEVLTLTKPKQIRKSSQLRHRFSPLKPVRLVLDSCHSSRSRQWNATSKYVPKCSVFGGLDRPILKLP